MAVSVHPLVLMSISDHLTRDQVHRPAAGSIGMIFGVQAGINVEIFASCEMPLLDVDGLRTIDKKFIAQQQQISAFSVCCWKQYD